VIVVHHLNNSRSQRVLWLLEELGVPYEVARYQRDPETRLAPRELKSVHPLGKSPIIVDDGQTIAETGLIFEYLCDHYDNGALAPSKGVDADKSERLRWLYWLHYAEGSGMPPLLLKLVISGLPPTAAAELQEKLVDPQVALQVDYWEAQLDRTGWFAGPKFRAADVIMGFPVEAAVLRLGMGANRSNLKAFLDRIHARAAYQRAQQRGQG
jgi:glutathione S-transferase